MSRPTTAQCAKALRAAGVDPLSLDTPVIDVVDTLVSFGLSEGVDEDEVDEWAQVQAQRAVCP